MNLKSVFWLFLLLLLFSRSIIAAQEPLPDFLKPWAAWIQNQNPEWQCADSADCAWPGYLEFDVYADRADFKFWVGVESKTNIVLPGKDNLWPEQLSLQSLDGRNAVDILVGRSPNGEPVLKLNEGRYMITGSFKWQEFPDDIPVSERIGFIDLNLEPGLQNQYSWRREKTNIIFSAQTTKESLVENEEQISIYRHLTQSYPQYLDTWVRLRVSGEPRILTLPAIDWPDTEKVSFDSRLPVELKADGSYAVQIRQGDHWLRLRSRFAEPVNEIKPVYPKEHMPKAEYWAFERNIQAPAKITGNPVDAIQVDMPADWQHLPAYKIDAEQGLKIEASNRNMNEQKPALSLNRQIWLSFSGETFSIQDSITGTMSEPWRLDMDDNGQLQRVQNGRQSLLITQDAEHDGVEVRDSQLNLTAISLWPATQTISKTGWLSGFDNVSAELNLPPGWRLFASSEKGSDAWLSQWQLWDIFIILFGIILTYRVIGFVPAAVASVFLILVYPEYPGICLVWTGLLVLIKSAQQIQGKFQMVALGLTAFCALILIMQTADITMTKIRQSIYPQLETPYYKSNQVIYDQAVLDSVQPVSTQRSMAEPMILESAAPRMSKGLYANHQEKEPEAYGENDFIQTGIGLPEWSWHKYKVLQASNVTDQEGLKLYLLSPWMVKLMAALSLLSLYLSLFYVWKNAAQQLRPEFKRSFGGVKSQAILPALIGFGIFFSVLPQPDLKAATAVTDQQLQELKTWLQQSKRCEHACFSFNSGQWVIDQKQLSLSLQLDVAEDTLVPLLTSDQWVPQSITLDGNDAKSLMRQRAGQLEMLVAKGRHRLELQGRISSQELLKFTLPDPLHQIAMSLDGWQQQRQSAASTLVSSVQFERTNLQMQNKSKTIVQKAITVPEFVQVTRRLQLGVQWKLQTEARRIAPESNAFSLQIPLVKGEKPRTGIKAKNGMADVDFDAGQDVVTWTSELSPVKQLELKAGSGQRYYEIWSINAGPLWQYTSEGIKPVATPGAEKVWQPSPADILTLSINRPEAKQAQSQSIENARLQAIEGELKNAYILSLALKAASPGDFQIKLPEEAQIDKVTLSGQRIYDIQGPDINISLSKGNFDLNIEWTQPGSDNLYQSLPEIASSLPLMNMSFEMVPLKDRWILHTNGPLMGPAVLYWGILAALILGAGVMIVVQKKVPFNLPVKSSDWLLIGLGTSTLFYFSLIPFALWSFIFGWWQYHLLKNKPMNKRVYTFGQIIVLGFTLMTGFILISVIPVGLLSSPDMQISGYNSSQEMLLWYSDYAARIMPQAGYIALPEWVFSVLMLIWSLWLASRLVQWFFAAIHLMQIKPVFKNTAETQSKSDQTGQQ